MDEVGVLGDSGVNERNILEEFITLAAFFGTLSVATTAVLYGAFCLVEWMVSN